MSRYLFLIAIFLISCQEKDFDLNDPEKSYAIAKEPYDDKNYEIALRRLGEFKSRFPYSRYAVESELLMANSHFELDHFEEAAATYSQFIKLHPKHEMVPFAFYRVGECYWSKAPEEIDREQDLTAKAVREWEVLLSKYPNSSYSEEAKIKVNEGKLRIEKSEINIAKFYCRKSKYHACVYKYISIIENSRHPEILKEALNSAAKALEKLSVSRAEIDKDDKTSQELNLFFRSMTADQMRGKAKEFRDKAESIKI